MNTPLPSARKGDSTSQSQATACQPDARLSGPESDSPSKVDLSDLDQIVATYQSRLLRYAHHWCRRFAWSCDVVQDTFAKLVEQRQRGTTFRSEAHLRAWLYRVCRQRAIDLLRKEKRMSSSLETDAVPDPTAGDPADSALRRDTSDQVQHQLNRLSENQQEVVRLKFEGGLSYREIADVTGLSVSNVGFLLHTAISTLKERLAT